MSDGPETGVIELENPQKETARFEIIRELLKQNAEGLKRLAKR